MLYGWVGEMLPFVEAGKAVFAAESTDMDVDLGRLRLGRELDVVVERTIELLAHAEAERARLGLPPVSYEVGTEEVHGGLADFDNFDRFLAGLEAGLKAAGLAHAWPASSWARSAPTSAIPSSMRSPAGCMSGSRRCELCARERAYGRDSGFEKALKAAVVESNRWRKWLTPDEAGRRFDELAPER